MFEGAEYSQFLQEKRQLTGAVGLPILPTADPVYLWPWQAKIVRWALSKGRAAIFADTGLGKTRMEAAWADVVATVAVGRVLVVTTLGVTSQWVKEAQSVGVDAVLCRDGVFPESARIVVTNYERLHLFNAADFVAVVLDESGILKTFTGATCQELIAKFADTPYRLAASATPAPNDHTELGNHAEFLGVMTRTEMLATYFTHDGGKTSEWRLKGHAVTPFWRFVGSWAVGVKTPSDLGYPDDGYTLPPLTLIEHCVEANGVSAGSLFGEELTISGQRSAKRESLSARVAKVAELVAAEPGRPWLIWCELNAEGDALTAAIPGAVQVSGSQTPEEKEEAMAAFSEGRVRVLVSKPSICGFGLNFQHCARMAFVGLTHSYEQFYQAVRRCWRFGQAESVNAHVVYGERETAILRNLKKKEGQAQEMSRHMVGLMDSAAAIEAETAATARVIESYKRDAAAGNNFTLYRGDCVEVLRELPSESVGFSVFSPPFASLYTYTNSDRDMGNCRDDAEFMAHFGYAVAELFRVLQPGRLVAFHCMNLPTSKERDGYIGIRDFRGELIRLFESHGFIYHSEVTIWKDPVTAMQRTKALGLLYKQLKKDSAMSRQGIADYLVVMRKPGTNPNPVTKDPADFPCDLWQNYASPVWMDINPSDTLQRESAREEQDERHICPLQLEVIRRAVRLWTNPGDTVLSPFAGIGSEGHAALQMGRRFVGVELKGSYYEQAAANLRAAEVASGQVSMFYDCEGWAVK